MNIKLLLTATLLSLTLVCGSASAQSFSVSVYGDRGSFSYSQRDDRGYRYAPRYNERGYVRVRYEDRRPVYPVYRYEVLEPAYVNPYIEPKCVARNNIGEFYSYYC